MRISDWSSDVCSSDLPDDLALEMAGLGRRLAAAVAFERIGVEVVLGETVFLDDHFGAHELAEHDAGIFFFEPLGFIMAEQIRKSTRLNSSHQCASRMPSSA